MNKPVVQKPEPKETKLYGIAGSRSKATPLQGTRVEQEEKPVEKKKK